MRTRTAVAAAAALAAPPTPTTAEAHTQGPASAPQRHTPGDTITLPARGALTALTVQDEDRTGYSRALLRHWTDADPDGCSTRAEVLLEEAVTAPEQGPDRTQNGSARHPPYDDTAHTQTRARALDIDIDIDHLGPLAEPWDCGASAWTPAERQAYANDLDDPRTLIAVCARFAKQTLGWTTPKLRTPEAADRWTWILIVAHTHLRLARPLTADLRRPWERPTTSDRLTPDRLTPAGSAGGSGTSAPASPARPVFPHPEAPAPDGHPTPRTNTRHPATTSARPSNAPRPSRPSASRKILAERTSSAGDAAEPGACGARPHLRYSVLLSTASQRYRVPVLSIAD